MKRALSFWAVAAIALCACSPSPVTPTPVNGGPGRVFDFLSGTPLSSPSQVTGYTKASRFFLYDNGRFALSYPGFEYRGTYREAGEAITFQWDGWSTAGSWDATGTLVGGQLTVEYNLVMQLSDFEDAVYALVK